MNSVRNGKLWWLSGRFHYTLYTSFLSQLTIVPPLLPQSFFNLVSQNWNQFPVGLKLFCYRCAGMNKGPAVTWTLSLSQQLQSHLHLCKLSPVSNLQGFFHPGVSGVGIPLYTSVCHMICNKKSLYFFHLTASCLQTVQWTESNQGKESSGQETNVSWKQLAV